jgi:hypothetical protein
MEVIIFALKARFEDEIMFASRDLYIIGKVLMQHTILMKLECK